MNDIECPTCGIPTHALDPGEYFHLPEDLREAVDRAEIEHQDLCNKIRSTFLKLEYTPLGPKKRREQMAEVGQLLSIDDRQERTRSPYLLGQALFDGSMHRAAELGWAEQHPALDVYCSLLPWDELLPADLAEMARGYFGWSDGRGLRADGLWTPELALE